MTTVEPASRGPAVEKFRDRVRAWSVDTVEGLGRWPDDERAMFYRFCRRAYFDAVLFGSSGWHHERLVSMLDLRPRDSHTLRTNGSP